LLADYHRNSNLPTIQIIVATECKISEYYKKVKGKKTDIFSILDLPFDFHSSCPICQGIDCAQFIGYYERPVINEKGTYYKAFPVARFLCNRKGGKPLIKHKTFSLLPHQLIPYSKYSIDFILKTLKSHYVDEQSVMEIQTYLSGFNKEGIYFDLPASSVNRFKKFILEVINKLLSSGYYQDAEKLLQESCTKNPIKTFIKFAESFYCYKTNPRIRGPCALSYDFYLKGGGWLQNSYFLFGTPSQFKIA